MLASRARRRAQARPPFRTLIHRQRAVSEVFLAASCGGVFEALVAVLNPEVVLRADRTAVALGASGEVRGAAAAVASTFSGVPGSRDSPWSTEWSGAVVVFLHDQRRGGRRGRPSRRPRPPPPVA